MRNALLVLVLLLLTSCQKPPAAAVVPHTFGDPTPALRVFLDKRPEVPLGRPQHFCIVEGAGTTAWVRWTEGNMLILWEPGDEYQIARSRRKLDLGKDVVATEAEIGGSTYLVTRQWVDQIQRDCESRGAKYTVEKTNNG